MPGPQTRASQGTCPRNAMYSGTGLGAGWPLLCRPLTSERCVTKRALLGSGSWIFRGAPGWKFRDLHSLSGC